MFYQNRNGVIHNLEMYEKIYVKTTGEVIADIPYDSSVIEKLKEEELPDRNMKRWMRHFFEFVAEGESFDYEDVFYAIKNEIIADKLPDKIEQIMREVDTGYEELQIKW